jgi:hypothetical protein
MRIPVAKKYRAFPELDRFTEAQRQRYLVEALRSARWWQRLTMLLEVLGVVLVAMVIAWIGLGFFAAWVARLVRSAAADNVAADRAFQAVMLVGSFGTMAVAVFGAFVLRDGRIVRRIRRRIEHARCPACSYSLLGLAVVRDEQTGGPMVVCPECGRRVDVAGMEGELNALTPAADASTAS